VGAVEYGDGVPVVEAVAGVADVEEGLVVVGGELGQPRHQLIHLCHTNLNQIIASIVNISVAEPDRSRIIWSEPEP
jgi:hypothetical protein